MPTKVSIDVLDLTGVPLGSGGGGSGSDGEEGEQGPPGRPGTIPPVFLSVNRGAVDQTGILIATLTTIVHTNKIADTNNWYDTSTGKYQPRRAGWYHFDHNAFFTAGLNGATRLSSIISLNGTAVFEGYTRLAGTAAEANGGSGMVYMNGSTDYIEHRVYQDSGTVTVSGAVFLTYLMGHYIGPG